MHSGSSRLNAWRPTLVVSDARTKPSANGIAPDDAKRSDAMHAGRQSPVHSPLVDFALNGLHRCWMPELGRWSHIYHLDGRSQPNQSVPPSDVFYTLNVLLGLSRLKRMPDDIDAPEIFRRNARLLTRLPVATYAYGMALWTAARLKLDIPADVAAHLDALLSDRRNWLTFRAQDLGMLLSGIVAQAKAGDDRWVRVADALFAFLVEKYHGPSGLFFDASSGLRGRFASFASQTYLTLACYHYGELTGHRRAIEIAMECTRKLIALQGPQGEWPWFFDAKQGRVLDFYEVYSVHQYGMAPAFLEHAIRHDARDARDALIKGFSWVLGDNQLRKPTVIPGLQLSIRSHIRKGEADTRQRRMLRAIRNTYLPRPAGLIDSRDVGLRLECRSYELGWILWSFGQCSDLPQLTHHAIFAGAGSAG